MTILLLPLAILAGFSMYLHFFDKYINVLDFPDLLRTGLYVSNSEREALIDKRLMKLNKKGFEDLTPIKNVIRSFNV